MDDEGRAPRILGYTVERPRTTPTISRVEVEERITLKEDIQQQARVEASWIAVEPIDIDVVERSVRERQEEILQKQVVAEEIKRTTAPPRVVEARRAEELARHKAEIYAERNREIAALERQGWEEERIAETIYGPPPAAPVAVRPAPVVAPPEPLVESLNFKADTAFRRLLLLAVIASIVKGLAK